MQCPELGDPGFGRVTVPTVGRIFSKVEMPGGLAAGCNGKRVCRPRCATHPNSLP